MAKAKAAAASSKTKAKAVAWKTLKHAKGPATRVPAQVKALVGGKDAQERSTAFWALWDTLVGDAAWFETSAPAVALLLDSLDKAGDQRASGLLLVAEILGGDALRGWLAPPDAPAAADERAARDEAVRRKAALLAALEQGDDDARAAAAMAVAMLPELAADSVPALVARAADHAAGPLARAGALLALGRVDIGNPGAEAAIAAGRAEDAPDVVRGAAGMAWLRQDAKHAFAEARDEIAS